MKLQTTDYQKLLSEIGGYYQNARKAVEIAYWKIGKRIVEVEQGGKIHAPYGEGLLKALSTDLTRNLGRGFSVNNLERMRQVYLQNPKSPTSGILPWSKEVELLPLEDPTKRQQIKKRAKTENLSVRKIRELVHEETQAFEKTVSQIQKPQPPKNWKRPADLRLDTYQVAKPLDALKKNAPEGSRWIDLGFYLLRAASERELKSVTITPKPAFTYRAFVERVIDGDTLWLQIQAGFGNALREKIRLNQINTPELGTPEGEKAKRWLTALLPPETPVLIKTYRNDLYGRFVADLFYSPEKDASFEKIAESGVWLNEKLVQENLAEFVK